MADSAQDERLRGLEELVRKQGEQIALLKKMIIERDEKIAELERIIEEWKRGHRYRPKRRRRKNKGKASSAPKKKPGRKEGHPGAFREVEGAPDRTVNHPKEHCDDCSVTELVPTGQTREQLVEEIIPAQRLLERHLTFEYRCSCCGKVQWSTLPPELGQGAPGGRPILGPSVLSFAASLRYEYGLSFSQVARFLSVHADLKVTPSGIYQLLERTARKTRGTREEILLRARELPFLHMDETTWLQEGRKLWAWIIGSEELSVFHIDPRRSHDVIEQLLCEADEQGELVRTYGGVVVSDFMGAYWACEWMKHQWCWVHLLRDGDKQFDVDPSPETLEFRDRLTAIYHDALLAQASQNPSKKHGIRVRLGQLAHDPLLGLVHPELVKLQKRIQKHFQGLLTFLDQSWLPAHNNNGERYIRPLVIFRATSFCTRSDRGSEAHAHWMSVIQTARKQEVPLDAYLRQAVANHTLGQPPPSLFSWPTSSDTTPLTM